MVALLLLAPLTVVSTRDVRYVNVAEEVDLHNVERVERTVTATRDRWTVERSRMLQLTWVSGHRVLAGPVRPERNVTSLTEYVPQVPTQGQDPLAARLDRLYLALLERKPLTFPADPGGLPEARVEFPDKGFRYAEDRFQAEGTFALDAKTGLPATLRLTAKNVPLPGGEFSADLTVEEKPAE